MTSNEFSAGQPVYPKSGKPAPVAILIVIGGDDPKQGSWIGLCLSCIARFTNPELYQLYLWNNNPDSAAFRETLARHAPAAYVTFKHPDECIHEYHAIPLQRLYEMAKTGGHEWIVTMDSDAHPVRAGWLETLITVTTANCVLAGVWRDELSDAIAPYIHPSGLCVRHDFMTRFALRLDTCTVTGGEKVVDALSDFTEIAIANNLAIHPLRRSNARQFHKLIGGIYADCIYHHGAGSREYFIFWGEQDSFYQRKLNTVITRLSGSLLMSRYDEYIAYLRGEGPGSLFVLGFLKWLQAGKENFARRLVLNALVYSYRLRTKLESLW